MPPRWDSRAGLQAALTNVLILIHKPIPVLVDVLQRFLGSKAENRMQLARCSANFIEF